MMMIVFLKVNLHFNLSFSDEETACDYSSEDYEQCIALENGCKTVDEKPCIFPFMHRGKEVNNCISGIRRRQPWCPTEVDSNGVPVPGKWGTCDDQCPTSTTATTTTKRTTTTTTTTTRTTTSTITTPCKFEKSF